MLRLRFICVILLALMWACASKEKASEEPPAPAADAKPVSGIVNWSVPAEWVEEPVSPGGPVATYRLPRFDDDEPEDGRAWVYYFGPKGSRIDSLAEQSYSEFVLPEGGNIWDTARKFGAVFNNVSHRFVELAGTYAPPDGPRKPGYRLLSSVAQTSSGPYFVKVIGPERTIDYYKTDFYSMMSSFEESNP